MLYVEMVLLAIGLAMDSLAVSVTGGALAQQRCGFYKVFKVASVMALFQAGMTLIGFFAGKGFERYIEAFDHWVAFALLLYLGGKMIYDSTREEEEECRFDIFRWRTLCGLGVATSIDALAVGISLAIIKAPIVIQTVIIGLVTFVRQPGWGPDQPETRFDRRYYPDRDRHEDPDRASFLQLIFLSAGYARFFPY